MRTVHWLFIVGAALFIGGIGFIIAAARTVRDAAPVAAAASASAPIASVKQIMQGIVAPSATTVFESVGSIVSAQGTEERMPRTDAEWEAVGVAAATLVESGNLLLMSGRAVDAGDWVEMSQAMMESGNVALQATAVKNVDQLFASGEAIYVSCNNCHRKYQRGS